MKELAVSLLWTGWAVLVGLALMAAWSGCWLAAVPLLVGAVAVLWVVFSF